MSCVCQMLTSRITNKAYLTILDPAIGHCNCLRCFEVSERIFFQSSSPTRRSSRYAYLQSPTHNFRLFAEKEQSCKAGFVSLLTVHHNKVKVKSFCRERGEEPGPGTIPVIDIWGYDFMCGVSDVALAARLETTTFFLH